MLLALNIFVVFTLFHQMNGSSNKKKEKHKRENMTMNKIQAVNIRLQLANNMVG